MKKNSFPMRTGIVSVFTAFFLGQITLFAQSNPQIYADIYQGSNPYNGVSNLYFSAIQGGKLFFNLKTDVTNELLVTDGDPNNIVTLKSSDWTFIPVVFDNKVYFGTVDAINGAELWSTDGTLPGTQMEAIIGGTFFAPSNFVVLNGDLYFHCGNANAGTTKQLYKLEAGSSAPELIGLQLYDPSAPIAYNGGVIFSASSQMTDTYLHKEPQFSDGTNAGTVLIRDIQPGPTGSGAANFFVFNNLVYFTADNGTEGTEIWVTDGTYNGTNLFKDINVGSGASMFGFKPGVLNNAFYFGADNGVDGNQLWSSDGTANGTNLLKVINPSGSSNPQSFVVLQDALFFLANDGVVGNELWKTEGTAPTTALFMDIVTGSESSTYSLLQRNVICDTFLLFDAGTSSNVEPWVCDGTQGGTQLISDLNPTGSGQDYETFYVDFNNQIFFGSMTGVGRELFVMDKNCQSNGVDEIEASRFLLYPNPANETLHIERDQADGESVQITLYNAQGQAISRFDLTALAADMDLSTYRAGVYYLSISSDGKFATHKIEILR
jgi:ELWxxDGT repeat protein